MIFSRDQVAAIRQGKLSATLLPESSKLKANTVQMLRRRVVRHDEDGKEQGTSVDTVEDVSPDGDRRPVKITILAVERLPLEELDASTAQACGYQSVSRLREWWCSVHPRSEVVTVVRFAVGDLVDRDRFLNWSGRAGGDYTQNPSRAIDRDAPALTPEQLAPMVKAAHERDQRRARQANVKAKEMPLEGRLGRLERIKRERRLDISRELRVIEQRVERAERLIERDDEEAA